MSTQKKQKQKTNVAHHSRVWRRSCVKHHLGGSGPLLLRTVEVKELSKDKIQPHKRPQQQQTCTFDAYRHKHWRARVTTCPRGPTPCMFSMLSRCVIQAEKSPRAAVMGKCANFRRLGDPTRRAISLSVGKRAKIYIYTSTNLRAKVCK